jgi:hypothetical protein
MNETTIVRNKLAAELRRLAKTTKDAERERKMLALANEWEDVRQLKETATSSTR